MPVLDLKTFGQWNRYGRENPHHTVLNEWRIEHHWPFFLYLLCLLTVAENCPAQTNSGPTISNRTVNIVSAAKVATAKADRQAFIRKYHPLRVVGDKLFDFTPLMAADHPSTYSDWYVKGKVFQVTDDGLLISCSFGNVFLRNYRNEGSVIDGSEVTSAAVLIGRYRYTSVTGGTRAIPEFDCGHYWNPAEEKFLNKLLIRPNGIQAQMVPVWEIDLP